MSTIVYTDMNTFNFIRKRILLICVRKVTVHLQQLLKMMSAIVHTDLNTFKFIGKQFLLISVRKFAVHL
jgi:hypothetical protein